MEYFHKHFDKILCYLWISIDSLWTHSYIEKYFTQFFKKWIFFWQHRHTPLQSFIIFEEMVTRYQFFVVTSFQKILLGCIPTVREILHSAHRNKKFEGECLRERKELTRSYFSLLSFRKIFVTTKKALNWFILTFFTFPYPFIRKVKQAWNENFRNSNTFKHFSSLTVSNFYFYY